MSIHDDSWIEIFASAALESTDIICASPNFHGKPMFSNINVSAKNEENEDINWYGLDIANTQVLPSNGQRTT
ncbi:6816_t:CDS:2 [Ambispora leptoticha]|uniref:6816_t:CDS:1 n=1 Tax=Ambispora leptoticha TaxID=144679 RepID=A0A9N9HMQ7_9GLOM|nr:6816_t:CDS:2 [Ambispora leptoticha]